MLGVLVVLEISITGYPELTKMTEVEGPFLTWPACLPPIPDTQGSIQQQSLEDSGESADSGYVPVPHALGLLNSSTCASHARKTSEYLVSIVLINESNELTELL